MFIVFIMHYVMLILPVRAKGHTNLVREAKGS